MKKIFVILVLMIVFKNGIAQITLAQVNSDSSAAAFVRQQNYSEDAPQWKHFYLTAGNEWKDYYNFTKKEEDNIAQSMLFQSWAKIDLNHDGKEDLIVSGYIAKSAKDRTEAAFKLLFFLSTVKENVYDKINLVNDAVNNFPVYFDIKTINTQNCVQLYRWYFKKDTSSLLPFRVDTVQYNSFVKNFINYSKSLYPANIRKIDYTVKDDEAGSYHNLIIEKTADDKFLFRFSQLQSGDKNAATHSIRIKEELFDNIDSLARQLNTDEDSVTLNEDSDEENLPVKMSIYYADGTKKIITDYGQTYNYTLLAIYETLENTMNAALQRMQRRSNFWSGMGEVLGEVGVDLL